MEQVGVKFAKAKVNGKTHILEIGIGVQHVAEAVDVPPAKEEEL